VFGSNATSQPPESGVGPLHSVACDVTGGSGTAHRIRSWQRNRHGEEEGEEGGEEAGEEEEEESEEKELQWSLS